MTPLEKLCITLQVRPKDICKTIYLLDAVILNKRIKIILKNNLFSAMFFSSWSRYFNVLCLLMSRKLTWMFWEEGVLLGYSCSLLSNLKIIGCSLIHIYLRVQLDMKQDCIQYTHWALKGRSIAVKHFTCAWKEKILHLENNVQNPDYHVCALSVWFILLVVNNKCCLD